MIIPQIIGGLGNQMFQYAAGRALALRKETACRLDVSGFAGYGLRQFELQRIFHCPAAIATDSDVRQVLGGRASAALQRIAARLRMPVLRSRRLVVEPDFNYWAGINDVPQDCYLVGYWQSEKYFQDADEIIRADFAFKTPLSDRNAKIARHIGGVNAVSLHVRRGDYASNPHTNSVHGLCSLDYYRRAIRRMSERVERPYFFIFSDDIAWVKGHLRLDFPCEYVEHNQGSESYNDMRLMSLCKHHIIANSSFSWWGAWLRPDPDKLVVAPMKWFVSGCNVGDLIPRGWVTL